MMDFNGLRSLVTGASSGIGWELSRVLAARGSHLVLVARREERLHRLAEDLRAEGIEVVVLPTDLAEPGACEQLCCELNERQLTVDVLVNNAGFGALGQFIRLDVRRQIEMVEVNVVALTRLTRLLLPAMVNGKRGGVLNVASTAGFQPGPNMAVYYATKAYVLSLSEALAEELRGTGVHVSCLAPGPTDTGFGTESGMNRSLLFRLGTMDARRVAQAGIAGLRRNRTIVIPGLLNRTTAASVRWIPRWIVRRTVKMLQSV